MRIHHSCLWQRHSPYEACSASHMALAPSVHIATHFGQGISCSRKKLSITTQTLKAEGRLTRLWIHLIVVQNNLLSGVSRLVVPSYQLPIHQFKGGKSKGMLFSFFH